MIHAITFTTPDGEESWNTRDAWGLALQTQPTFVMPPVKTKFLDYPAGNGVLDLSTAITGYPVYGNRQGSFTFVLPALQADWQVRIAEIAEILHGQYMHIIQDDDPGWYFEGRVAVNIDACERQYGSVVIDYDVGPFRWAMETTGDPWPWDPFSFETGVIYNGVYLDPDAYLTGTLAVSTTPAALTFTAMEAGFLTLLPTFTAADADVILTLDDGETQETVTIAAGTPATVDGLQMVHGVWTYNGAEITITAATDSGAATLTTALHAYFNNGAVYGGIEVTTTPAALTFTTQETGRAPVQPVFAVQSGGGVTIAVQTGGETVASVTATTSASKTVPDLVLWYGRWLYNGQPATVQAYTESGTSRLGLLFRVGRL